MLIQHLAIRKRVFVAGVALVGFILLIGNFWLVDSRQSALQWTMSKLPLLGAEEGNPVVGLMREADARFEKYISKRPKDLSEVVRSYQNKWGRPPPPGFDKWFEFAKDRNCFHYDDFDQINHDLRPFWSIKPRDLRKLVRGLIDEKTEHSHLAGFHIRDGVLDYSKQTTNERNYRTDLFAEMIRTFVKHLPNMDIALNRLDQPRVVVPWEDLQKALVVEESSRGIPEHLTNNFSVNEEVIPEGGDRGEWVGKSGRQYMEIAARGCPPESLARNPNNEALRFDAAHAIRLVNMGGLVKNFNLSSDLCTVGPLIQEQHGFLSTPSSISESKKLLPIFGECKVNVNNDILFPANMYYSHDKRYIYDGSFDVEWEEKEEKLFWRGITSGGVQTVDTWDKMHRHRLVQLTNSTHLRETDQEVSIIKPDTKKSSTKFEAYDRFLPAVYAEKYTDVGFSKLDWCVPNKNCDFLQPIFATKNSVSLAEQFKYKYIVDVDGHSFSGRWHAFLRSKSLGIKATIFREWHDSRLFAWKHFVPMDNSLRDLYTIMTYFTGLEKEDNVLETGPIPTTPEHGSHAQRIGMASREWANKVLRREDIEIYMFRLFLEYARLLDDNRDTIGFRFTGNAARTIRGAR